MEQTTDPDPLPLLSVRQAIDLIDATPVSPRIVRLPLSDCRGLRLAEDLSADRDYPPFDKSLMDGYAVRADDVRPDLVAQKPVELRVVGVVPAGRMPERGIEAGESMAVMTGAPVPAGTQAVVPVEQTQELGEAVAITKGVRAGYAVSNRGADMTAGQLVLPSGTLMEAPAIAVAATVGAAEVAVYARPRVAVLGTGDEIVPVDHVPGPGEIRNSNTFMLVSLLERLGCDVTDLGVVADQPDAIEEAIREGLSFDALFVTGGMSMGHFDYVPQTLVNLGVDLKVTKVRMKPGKPFVFGVYKPPDASDADDEGVSTKTSYVFGLPGNPISAYVCTLRLASRLLARLAGGVPQERWVTGRIEVGLPLNGPREFYQPVIRKLPIGHKSTQNELPWIEVLTWKGSADVFTLARANALLVREENDPALPKSTMVRVLEI